MTNTKIIAITITITITNTITITITIAATITITIVMPCSGLWIWNRRGLTDLIIWPSIPFWCPFHPHSVYRPPYFSHKYKSLFKNTFIHSYILHPHRNVGLYITFKLIEWPGTRELWISWPISGTSRGQQGLTHGDIWGECEFIGDSVPLMRLGGDSRWWEYTAETSRGQWTMGSQTHGSTITITITITIIITIIPLYPLTSVSVCVYIGVCICI